MKNFVGAFLVLVVGCLLNRDVGRAMADMTSHPARPGTTRKSAKGIMAEHKKSGKGLIYAYYASWSNYFRDMTENGPKVDVMYVSFASFKLEYNGDLGTIGTAVDMMKQTGLEFGTLDKYFASMTEVRKQNPNIIIMLSLGGETYQPKSHEDALQRISMVVKLVDDLGFDGVDLDYEPSGSFDMFTDKKEIDFFVEYATQIRNTMCEDKLISISVSSNGALPCSHMSDKTLCSEPNSPYGPEYVAGNLGPVEDDIIVGASYRSAGTAIAIMNTLQNVIDIIFIQSYNLTAANNPLSMLDLYKSFAYFADKYGFDIAVGFTAINRATRYAVDNAELVDKLSKLIKETNKKSNRADGFGLWSLSNAEAQWKDEDFLPLWLMSLKS